MNRGAPTGAVVGQRFEIEGLAREGGMGSVYRARDRATGERVAVKIAHPQAMQHAERFAREATVLSELRHPGIVRYVAHGRTEHGDLYLAMEWLEGEDLSQRLVREGLTVSESVALVARAAEILASAHRQGLVHRDLKPSNLFLVGGDVTQVKVLDFGIVRVASEPDRSTQTGMILGTIGYMAPEQARGAHDLDARADVFALGCVLFECLTGRPAFSGRDVLAVQAKILLEDAPRVDELRDGAPKPLCDLVARMLSKDPSARPADADALGLEIAALERAATTAPARGSERPVVLTTGEQRLLCVVMLSPTRGTPAVHDAAPTLASDVHGGSIVAMRDAVRTWGGRLEALANGSVVVTLEGTSAATDQAARAARCALALRAIVRDTAIAVATGRGDASGRLPVGEVIERAVEVLRLAEARLREPGVELGVELDALTAGLLDARFDVRTDPRATGRAQLVGIRASNAPSRTLLGRPTPFVGRARELGTLEAIFDECVGEGIAQAVLVEGPPGIGKSRLSWELAHRLRARDERVEIWTGRGDPMSAGSPFGLVTQVLRRGLGIERDDPAAVQHAKLRARVARLFEGGDRGRDRERIVEFLGELVGAPSPGEPSVPLRAARRDPILMGDQMRRAFEDWLAAECAFRPVVIVLEDLHWGDLPTVQFLDGALRHLAQDPSPGEPGEGAPRALMVLALARPEVHASFPSLWSARKLTRMALGELTRKASERLVRHALGDATDGGAVTRMVEQAAGNVLYLEEVIRAAVADPDARETRAPRGAPQTVLAMVQARLEALPAEARRVLRAASVFGQVFWRAGVHALLRDHTLAEVSRWVDELERRELVVRRHSAAVREDDVEYAFRHALVREAAYAMLVDRDRALGHRLAGEWLEIRELADVGDAARVSHAVALAEHFERGGLPERAARWFRRAAEQALEGNDFDAVISRAERGIACGDRLEILGPLRLLQAEGHRWRGQLAEAERHALDALQALPEDSVSWFAAAGELAVACSLRGSNERLVEVGELLCDVPARPEILGAQVVAWSRASTWLLLHGFGELGERLVQRIDDAVARLAGPDPAVTARVHYTHATRALVSGDTGEYLRLSEAAAIDFEHAGILRSLCVQRRNVGIAHLQLGDPAEAERVFRSILDEARRMSIGTLAAEVDHWLGIALAHEGDLAEAQRFEARAIEAALAHGARFIEARSRACLAYILLMGPSPGDLERAEAEARRAVELSTDSPGVRASSLAILARVRLAQGAIHEASAEAREALALVASSGGIEEGEALVRLVHAEALRATGELDEARRAISDARARLLERAAKIRDDELRRGFLERVPENARTLALSLELEG